MWLLPTRGRKQLCQEALDACAESNMTSTAILIIDSRVDLYQGLIVPDNFMVMHQPWDMAECMRYIFKEYPHEKYYGWLSDDLRPQTDQWDLKLIEAAGDWLLSDCEDDYVGRYHHSYEHTLGGAFCWGGKLVRAVGFWAMEGVKQGGVDDFWTELLTYGIHPPMRKHLDEVFVRHDHYKTGRREIDDTDDWERDGEIYIQNDLNFVRDMIRSGAAIKAMDRIIEAKKND